MFGFLSKLFGGGGGRTSYEDAKALVDAGAVIIDVRTPGEFASGHAKGALNVPVQQLPARLSEIDASKGVVLYCASGMRSARAASILRDAGIDNVHDIGPLSAWAGEMQR